MAEVEVTIDASKGLLTIRGEQEFVSDMLERYKSVFENAPKPVVQAAASGSSNEQHQAPAPNASVSTHSLVGFSNVYDVEGDDISILVSPPGNNLTAQARAMILLYLYARHKVGSEPVAADDIKDQCKIHACFDSKNFASHLKSQKNLVTTTGTNSTLSARLTVPGRKAAEEMATLLQNA